MPQAVHHLTDSLEDLEHGLKSLLHSQLMTVPAFRNMYGAIQKHYQDVNLAHLTGTANDLRNKAMQDTTFYNILATMLCEVSGQTRHQREGLQRVHTWYLTNKHVLSCGPRFGRVHRHKKGKEVLQTANTVIQAESTAKQSAHVRLAKHSEMDRMMTADQSDGIPEASSHELMHPLVDQMLSTDAAKASHLDQLPGSPKLSDEFPPDKLPETVADIRKVVHPISSLANPHVSLLPSQVETGQQLPGRTSPVSSQRRQRPAVSARPSRYESLQAWQTFSKKRAHGQDVLNQLNFVGRSGTAVDVRYTAHDRGECPESHTRCDYWTLDTLHPRSVSQDAREDGNMFVGQTLEDFWQTTENMKPSSSSCYRSFHVSRARSAPAVDQTRLQTSNQAPAEGHQTFKPTPVIHQCQQHGRHRDQTVTADSDDTGVRLDTVMSVIDTVTDSMTYHREKLVLQPELGFRQPSTTALLSTRELVTSYGNDASPAPVCNTSAEAQENENTRATQLSATLGQSRVGVREASSQRQRHHKSNWRCASAGFVDWRGRITPQPLCDRVDTNSLLSIGDWAWPRVNQEDPVTLEQLMLVKSASATGLSTERCTSHWIQAETRTQAGHASCVSCLERLVSWHAPDQQVLDTSAMTKIPQAYRSADDRLAGPADKATSEYDRHVGGPPPVTTTVSAVHRPPPVTTTVSAVHRPPPATTMSLVCEPPPVTTAVSAVHRPPPVTTMSLVCEPPPVTTMSAVHKPPPATTMSLVCEPLPVTTTVSAICCHRRPASTPRVHVRVDTPRPTRSLGQCASKFTGPDKLDEPQQGYQGVQCSSAVRHASRESNISSFLQISKLSISTRDADVSSKLGRACSVRHNMALRQPGTVPTGTATPTTARPWQVEATGSSPYQFTPSARSTDKMARAIAESSQSTPGARSVGKMGRPIAETFQTPDPDDLLQAIQLHRQAATAVDIQRIFRGYVTRTSYRSWMSEERHKREDARRAIVNSQRMFRAHVWRKKAIYKRPALDPGIVEWARDVKELQTHSLVNRQAKLANIAKQMSFRQRETRDKLAVIGPHVEVYSACHPKRRGSTSPQLHTAAVNIQKIVRGWLVRRQLQKLSKKAVWYGSSFHQMARDYKAMLKRVQQQHGIAKPRTAFSMKQFGEYMDLRRRYESIFQNKSFEGELELGMLPSFFRECGLYPSQTEIEQALDVILCGPDSQRPDVGLTKRQVLDLIFYIYVPDAATGLASTRHSTWMNPIVGGQEARRLLGHTNIEPAPLAPCLRLVIEAKSLQSQRQQSQLKTSLRQGILEGEEEDKKEKQEEDERVEDKQPDNVKAETNIGSCQQFYNQSKKVVVQELDNVYH